MTGDLNKALVQTEVVSDGVLPALFVVFVVREVLHDELVYPIQGQSFLGTAPDGHHYESIVTEWRLLRLLAVVRLLQVFVVVAIRIVAVIVSNVIVFGFGTGRW